VIHHHVYSHLPSPGLFIQNPIFGNFKYTPAYLRQYFLMLQILSYRCIVVLQITTIFQIICYSYFVLILCIQIKILTNGFQDIKQYLLSILIRVKQRVQFLYWHIIIISSVLSGWDSQAAARVYIILQVSHMD